MKIKERRHQALKTRRDTRDQGVKARNHARFLMLETESQKSEAKLESQKSKKLSLKRKMKKIKKYVLYFLYFLYFPEASKRKKENKGNKEKRYLFS